MQSLAVDLRIKTDSPRAIKIAEFFDKINTNI